MKDQWLCDECVKTFSHWSDAALHIQYEHGVALFDQITRYAEKMIERYCSREIIR